MFQKLRGGFSWALLGQNWIFKYPARAAFTLLAMFLAVYGIRWATEGKPYPWVFWAFKLGDPAFLTPAAGAIAHLLPTYSKHWTYRWYQNPIWNLFLIVAASWYAWNSYYGAIDTVMTAEQANQWAQRYHAVMMVFVIKYLAAPIPVIIYAAFKKDTTAWWTLGLGAAYGGTVAFDVVTHSSGIETTV